MGIGIAGEYFATNKVFNEGYAAPTRRVIGVGNASWTEWTPHQLVIADHAITNPSQNRRLGQAWLCWRNRELGVFDEHAATLVDKHGPCENVAVTATPLDTLPELDLESELDRPWSTTVWDDPINLMTYVTYVFMDYFKFSKEKADYLMLLVHTEGKATVSTGSREAMEKDVAAMHTYGLWATLAKD